MNLEWKSLNSEYKNCNDTQPLRHIQSQIVRTADLNPKKKIAIHWARIERRCRQCRWKLRIEIYNVCHGRMEDRIRDRIDVLCAKPIFVALYTFFFRQKIDSDSFCRRECATHALLKASLQSMYAGAQTKHVCIYICIYYGIYTLVYF